MTQKNNDLEAGSGAVPIALGLETIKNTAQSSANGSSLPKDILSAWAMIPKEIREALVNHEILGNVPKHAVYGSQSTFSTATESDSATNSSRPESVESDAAGLEITQEICPQTGALIDLQPLERAPDNVFAFARRDREDHDVENEEGKSATSSSRKIITSSRGWRNVFTLPISYDVNLIARGTIFDVSNAQLFQSTGIHEEGYNRRFAAVDADVYDMYGAMIHKYFEGRGIELSVCVLNGGEADKRPQAVDKLLDSLCEYKLRRREPFLAIGGGVLLDIAGMAANLYRRGVPFVRVPTTLLAIVDASVGVKNGVDYCCGVTGDTYKNRVGSFYAPSSCLLDTSFISTQDCRNISNGFGEIVKLALVRSQDLFELVEAHGAALIESKFAPSTSIPSWVGQRIIDLSIQIMLEELGPNLWEYKLDRCVDYGHTFSKLLEMVPGADIMHGEAVNVDGFFCVILSHIRGYITMDIVNRVFKCMKSLSLPTSSENLLPELAWQSCKDAIEHRNGEQRIPLITGIGESICVSDITEGELSRGLAMLSEFDH